MRIIEHEFGVMIFIPIDADRPKPTVAAVPDFTNEDIKCAYCGQRLANVKAGISCPGEKPVRGA